MLRKGPAPRPMLSFVHTALGDIMNRACTLALALIAGAALTTPAVAADEGYCRDYARAALRQVHEARELHHCRRELRMATRWSEDYRVHYDWCRSVSRDQAEHKRDIRTRHIEECRGR